MVSSVSFTAQAPCKHCELIRTSEPSVAGQRKREAAGLPPPVETESSFARPGRSRAPVPHALPTYAAWLVLLGCLLSTVFALFAPAPTVTLICFGLASAFLGRVIFSTPLS